jgi:hypothetical protein
MKSQGNQDSCFRQEILFLVQYLQAYSQISILCQILPVFNFKDYSFEGIMTAIFLLQGIPQFHWYHDFYMRANILTAIQ